MEEDMTVMEVVLKVLEEGGAGNLSLFFSIAWDFRWRRNKMVHDKQSIELKQEIENALSLSRRFIELKQVPKAKTKEFFYWKPPPPDFLNLNMDGAVFGEL